MNCFFLGRAGNKDRLCKEGIVSFIIPDLGVLFKTRFCGSFFECEYMSLLSLLAFIDRSPKIFNDHKIDIYTDNPLIVHQVTKKVSCSEDIRSHRDKAVGYRQKFPYSLGWVPSYENRARELLLRQSREDWKFNLDLDIFARSTEEQR